MDFLGIGWGEILVILIVALLVWGPNRIVDIGRTLGKTMGSFKKAAGDFKAQVTRELEMQEKESKK